MNYRKFLILISCIYLISSYTNVFALPGPIQQVVSVVTTSAGTIPVFDAQYESDGASTTTVTYDHTVGAGCTNPIIVVDIEAYTNGSATINTMTIGKVNATFIDSQGISGYIRWVYMYQRAAVSTGANEINVVFASANDTWHVSSRSYCGVHQTVPVGTAVKNVSTDTSSQTPTASGISSATNELVIDAVVIRDEGWESAPVCSADSPQQERDNYHASTVFDASSSEKAGAASTTMSWFCTNTQPWAIIAVPLKPL